jgi:hypothetical protein
MNTFAGNPDTGACIGDRACANNPNPIAAFTSNGDPDPTTGLGVCEVPFDS